MHLIVGTIIMAVMMSILNYLFILPAYTALLKFPDMRNLVVPWYLTFQHLKRCNYVFDIYAIVYSNAELDK